MKDGVRLPWQRVESDVDFASRVESLRWLTKQTKMHSSYLAAILRHRQQIVEVESGHWRVGKWNRRQDSMGTLTRVRQLFAEGSWHRWKKTWGSSMKIDHHSRIAPEENRWRRALVEERDEDHNDGQQANEHDDLSRETRASITSASERR